MKKKKTASLCALALCLLASGANAETYAPLPLRDAVEMKERFYQNPLPVKDIGDPFILPTQDGYCAFATGGVLGFNVWRSGDLKAFTKEKALKKLSWAAGDYWAPEVFAYDGRYVMLYTVRWTENQSLRIGIAFADEPQGPYTDPLERPLFDFGYAAIDATLVLDDTGAPYLIYSRDCSENVVEDRHESHLYGVEMTRDLLTVVGEPVLLTQPDAPWETQSGDYRWNEGPAVVRHDGRYYLFYSANYFAGKEYAVGVATADHPLGPYTKQENNPILNFVESDGEVRVSGPGHNSFFTVGEELFTAYHTHTYPLAPSGNRQLCYDRAGFHADGTAYINGPTLARQLLPLGQLGLCNHAAAAKGEGIESLVDGDACISPASEDYAWRGQTAELTWDAPVAADMLVIYPAESGAVSGRVIINGAFEAPFAIGGERQVGESAILSFDEMTVQSLRIELETGDALGEIMVIGRPEA